MYKLTKLNLEKKRESDINDTEYKVGFVEILYVKEDLTELTKVLHFFTVLPKKRSNKERM